MSINQNIREFPNFAFSKKTIDEGTWMGMLSSYLPSTVTDTLSTLNQDRAYATATLPCAGVKNVISLV